MATINPTQQYDIIYTLTFSAASGDCPIRLYRGSASNISGTVYYRAGTSGSWTTLSVSGTSTTFPVTDTTMQVAHNWNKSGNDYMTPSFQGATNITSIAISQKSPLTGTMGNFFMYCYAYNCSSLTSLDVPDTSGLTSVGDFFMYYYAYGCSSLIELVLPAVGWFENHNVSWSVPSGRLGVLEGHVLNSDDLNSWKALTAEGKTLYTNYIRDPELVYYEEYCEYVADLIRTIIQSQSYNADTKRSIAQSQTYQADTFRKVNRAYQYSADTERITLKDYFYSTDTFRKVNKAYQYSADTERITLIVWGLSNDWSATEQALKVRSYSNAYHGHSFYLDIQRDVWFTLRAKIKNVKNALYGQFYLALYNSAGTCIGTNYVPEILAQYNWTNHNTPDYTEAWITYRIPSGVYADAVKYTVQLLGSGTSESEIYMKDIQLEQKPYKTTWHAYNSTRSPETLSLPTNVLNPQQGSVECWVLVNDASKRMISGTYPTIFMADGGGAGKGIWLMHEDTAADFRVQIANQSASKNIRIADSLVTNGWHHFACTWNSAQAKLYLDGQLKGIMVDPPLPSAINALTVGCWGSGHQIDTLIDDFRISSIARSDAEILANYQSGRPVGFDSYTTYYEPFDGLYDWQVVGVVFQNPRTVSLQVKIEPSKTKIGDQYIDSLGLWDTITLPMLERPDIELAPPECNKVTVYTDTIEKSATVPGTSSDRIVEIRVEAPEGSSEAYCQQMADAILAAKSKERLSITCKVPLVTSLRFGERVPVILHYIGATIDKPYMAHVQRMEHHILDNPPYTILSLGDFLPDDIEALVRLLKEG